MRAPLPRRAWRHPIDNHWIREKVDVPVKPEYEDEFLRIEWDAQARIVELVWKRSSSAMTDDEYKTELIRFADTVDALRPPRILVDLCDFGFVVHDAIWEWRLANISPRYNSAGVQRFAFFFPPGLLIPARMNRPSAGEAFVTRAFNSRQQAVDWLTAVEPADAAESDLPRHRSS